MSEGYPHGNGSCIAGRPATPGYKGYSNYPTWNVVLWIFNEEDLYHYWLEQSDCGSLVEDLQLWAEENQPVLHGFYSDLLGHALGRVDWHEVAAAIREEA